ncbi:unnamed protein product [Cochlearia groenlandica]
MEFVYGSLSRPPDKAIVWHECNELHENCYEVHSSSVQGLFEKNKYDISLFGCCGSIGPLVYCVPASFEKGDVSFLMFVGSFVTTFWFSQVNEIPHGFILLRMCYVHVLLLVSYHARAFMRKYILQHHDVLVLMVYAGTDQQNHVMFLLSRGLSSGMVYDDDDDTWLLWLSLECGFYINGVVEFWHKTGNLLRRKISNHVPLDLDITYSPRQGEILLLGDIQAFLQSVKYLVSHELLRKQSLSQGYIQGLMILVHSNDFRKLLNFVYGSSPRPPENIHITYDSPHEKFLSEEELCLRIIKQYHVYHDIDRSNYELWAPSLMWEVCC